MKITFLPANRSADIAPEETVLAAARRAAVAIDAVCGGQGHCGHCRVQIIQGLTTPPTAAERRLLGSDALARGIRLACCVCAASDLVVSVPSAPAASANLTAAHGRSPHASYGVAWDIGTTTVEASLWELSQGQLLARAARRNEQCAFGADVLSRVYAAMESAEALAQVQAAVVHTLNDLLRDLCTAAEISPNEISDLVAVGNTAMGHLLLGISPAPLARAPYTPVFTAQQCVCAATLGLCVHPCATLTLLPAIAGHVGSDCTAMLLAADLDQSTKTVLAIDIGTNGELALRHGERLFCCSTAAGPAFEGASIRHGMRALPGAIAQVSLAGDDLALRTVADAAPVGLCGSGLLDAAAVLLRCGAMSETGRLLTEREARAAALAEPIVRRLVPWEQSCAITLATAPDGSPILLTQQDLRELQLAKAAIRAGAEILLQQAGLRAEELDALLLAGAFGSHLCPESALAIALLPAVPPERIHPIGNAALRGAELALLSPSQRERACALAAAAQHIDLSAHPDFQDLYIDAMCFDF